VLFVIHQVPTPPPLLFFASWSYAHPPVHETSPTFPYESADVLRSHGGFNFHPLALSPHGCRDPCTPPPPPPVGYDFTLSSLGLPRSTRLKKAPYLLRRPPFLFSLLVIPLSTVFSPPGVAGSQHVPLPPLESLALSQTPLLFRRRESLSRSFCLTRITFGIP